MTFETDVTVVEGKVRIRIDHASGEYIEMTPAEASKLQEKLWQILWAADGGILLEKP